MAKRASARGSAVMSPAFYVPRVVCKVADAVSAYMRVPMGAGNSVPWDPNLALTLSSR
jgi:phage terminase large subunit GpA-like protein